MPNRRNCTMEVNLHKGLLVILLLHLCQAQDTAPSSSNPEYAPPNLVDVIDAVKAAFEQAVKISKDNVAREVFEQVVEELVPKQDVAEQSPATADGEQYATGDALAAVVHEHGGEDTKGLTALHAMQEHYEAALDSSETEPVHSNGEETKEEVGLVQEPLEYPVEVSQMNTLTDHKQEKPHQESSQEAEVSVEETKIEPVGSIKEPTRNGEESVEEPEELESKGKHLVDHKDIGSDVPSVQVELPPDSATDGERQGKEAGEQVKDDEGKQDQKLVELLQKQDTLMESDGIGETEVGDDEKLMDIKDRESKVQKRRPERKLPKLAEQIKHMAESQPNQDKEQGVIKEMTLEGGVLVQNGREEVVVGGGRETVEAETVEEQVEGEIKETGGESKGVELMEETEVPAKATQVQKTPHETAEVILDMERAAVVKDVKGPTEPQEPVMAESNDVTQETNNMNGIVTSRDPLLWPVEPNQETLTPSNMAKALPPFPTQGLELADTGELEEEPADRTRPSSPEVWKIGAVAAAFFLILQTIITVIYILKCKRKTSSGAGTVKACEEGNESVENNMAKAETTIPAEEQNALNDLPKYMKVQQESIAMKTLSTESTVHLSNDL